MHPAADVDRVDRSLNRSERVEADECRMLNRTGIVAVVYKVAIVDDARRPSGIGQLDPVVIDVHIAGQHLSRLQCFQPKCSSNADALAVSRLQTTSNTFSV